MCNTSQPQTLETYGKYENTFLIMIKKIKFWWLMDSWHHMVFFESRTSVWSFFSRSASGSTVGAGVAFSTGSEASWSPLESCDEVGAGFGVPGHNSTVPLILSPLRLHIFKALNFVGCWSRWWHCRFQVGLRIQVIGAHKLGSSCVQRGLWTMIGIWFKYLNPSRLYPTSYDYVIYTLWCFFKNCHTPETQQNSFYIHVLQCEKQAQESQLVGLVRALSSCSGS